MHFPPLGHVRKLNKTVKLTRLILRVIALPQLKRLSTSPIPWTPLARPVSEATVAIVTTSGVHLRRDKPFQRPGLVIELP